jgi:RNA polymerase sigma factor (sigma-70 family)
MLTSVANTLDRDFQTLFSIGATGSMSDQELVELFVTRRGEAGEVAFAALVDRHGPMVWRVCRRALADPNDAEDAFQVTFLVLAKKARSIARRPLLANWLYGVAVRSAKDVKAALARRRTHEARYRAMTPAHDSHTDDDFLLSILDDELARLPEAYRSPIVLCDLEGMTHQQAARRLGVPAGTIASRLSRGRDRLRQGLRRRGFAGSSVPLAVFARDFGGMPRVLIGRTAELAEHTIALGASTAEVPAALEVITAGVIRSMLVAKLISKSSVALAIAVLSLSAASTLGSAARFGAGVHAGLPRSQSGSAVGPGGTPSGPETFAPADDLVWIDELTNADAATRARLKRCLSSARKNFAAVRRAIYEFDFRQESAALDAAGEPLEITVRNYRGKVYWDNGSVRYEFFGPPPMMQIDEHGRPRRSNGKNLRFEVTRTPKLLTFSSQDVLGNPDVRALAAPTSIQIWKDRYPAQLSPLDPLVFYAKNFRTDEASFRKHCESLRSIQSAEGDSTILLRFRRDDDARIEIICDKAADCLPTRWRIGRDDDGTWRTWGEDSCSWRKTGEIWFPAHQDTTGYVGKHFRPVKFFDLTIRNVRANADADMHDSIFKPGSPFPCESGHEDRK